MAHTQHPADEAQRSKHTQGWSCDPVEDVIFFLSHTCTCENSVVFLTGTTIKTSLQLAESSGSSCQRRRPEIKEMTCKAREATHMAKKKYINTMTLKTACKEEKNNDQNKIRLREWVFYGTLSYWPWSQSSEVNNAPKAKHLILSRQQASPGLSTSVLACCLLKIRFFAFGVIVNVWRLAPRPRNSESRKKKPLPKSDLVQASDFPSRTLLVRNAPQQTSLTKTWRVRRKSKKVAWQYYA